MGQMTVANHNVTTVDTVDIYCNVDKSFMIELASKAVIGKFVQVKEEVGAQRTLKLDSSTADSSCLASVVSQLKYWSMMQYGCIVGFDC